MEEQKEKPSIEEFYKSCSNGDLMYVECNSCGSKFGEPRSICGECGSKKVGWKKSGGVGKILTYTIIHVSPSEFKDKTPYVIGIVELKEGFRLMSLIKDVVPEEVKVGMEVKMGFEELSRSEWPNWGRYYFAPL